MNIFTLVGKIALDGADKAKEQLTGLEAYAKKNEAGLKAMGIGLTAFGTGMAALLGLATKAAIDEETSISHLRIALKNVGVSYDAVKDSLEGVISATMKKTAISDEEQRAILGRMVLVTNDYNKALKLLPLALDLAAAGQMDATTAATYLGKAIKDLENGAESVTIRLGQASVQFKSLAEIQERVGGTAEAVGNTTEGAIKKIKNSLDNLMASMGKIFLPILNKVADVVQDLIGSFNSLNQETKDSISIIGGVTTAWALLIGTLSLAAVTVLPKLIAGLKVAWALLVANPIGLTITAVAALAAGILLLAYHWENIVDPIGTSQRKMTAQLKAELEKQKQAALDYLNAQKTYAQQEYDARVEWINKRYGIQERDAQNAVELYRGAIEKEKAALDTLLDRERIAHEKRLSDLQSEYDAKVAYAYAAVALQNGRISKDIAALNKQTELEGRALKQQQDQDHLADLTKAYREAKTGEESVRTLKALNDFKAQMARDTILQQRQDQIDALRAQMDLNSQAASDFEKTQQAELKASQTAETDKFKAFSTTIADQKAVLDTALTENLARIETDRLAAIQSEKDKLKATQDRLADEEKALIESYKRQEEAAAEHARQMATALTRTSSISSQAGTAEQPPPDWLAPGASSAGFATSGEWGNMQHGGIIPEPTLLYSLRTRRFEGMAGEAGPEPVGFGGINITGNNFYVRHESDIDKIAEALIGKMRLLTGMRI